MITNIRLSFISILIISFDFSNQAFETIISDSLKDYNTFEKYWNYLYPWNSDHNGSARMYGSSTDHSQIYLKDRQIILKATRITKSEGKSIKYPNLKINYHSGAIHAKHKILINDQYPDYEIKGEFKAPIAPGTWPAFWLTGANTWPPEIDILEFKGNNVNWFNTFRTKSDIDTCKTTLDNGWHKYRIWMTKVSKTDVEIYFSIDEKHKAKHRGNFVGKPFNLIMNLQMEGGSPGTPPTKDTFFYGRSIYVGRTNALK
jgi:beta-glucanase (GH16 family)